MTSLYPQIISDINHFKDPQKAQILSRFFKTGPGQYGQGDIFLGITTPTIRSIAKKYYQQTDLPTIQKLLQNPIHEYRTLALILLIHQFESLQRQIFRVSSSSRAKLDIGDLSLKSNNNRNTSTTQNHQLTTYNQQLTTIFDFYLQNTSHINNWDLVDISAPRIIGAYLLDKDENHRKILYKLARSHNLWEKRIAIISTLTFIKTKQFQNTLNLAQILLLDEHDLIHKAVGWMLREIGKLDQKVEETFLMEHYKQMPRTCLRYAIEKFDEEKRQFYLRK